MSSMLLPKIAAFQISGSDSTFPEKSNPPFTIPLTPSVICATESSSIVFGKMPSMYRKVRVRFPERESTRPFAAQHL